MKRLMVLCMIFVTCMGVLWAQDAGEKKIFSGKFAVHSDDYNGYKVKVPVEFNLNDRGATTNWSGPIVNDFAASMSVNVVEMRDVSSQAIYDANYRSMKKNRDFTEVVPVKVKWGKKTVLAFRCREATYNSGTREEKAGNEHHRWHLYAYGNGRTYQCSVCGAYSAYKEKKLQALFEEILKSFELINTKK